MTDHGAPGSYLTLRDGTPVFGADDVEAGTVSHVLAVPDDDIFDGLVVKAAAGHRFVDATQVQEIFEGGVVLNVAASAVESMPEPSENPAALSASPDDTVQGGLHDKLRRAWDLVSGRY